MIRKLFADKEKPPYTNTDGVNTETIASRHLRNAFKQKNNPKEGKCLFRRKSHDH